MPRPARSIALLDPANRYDYIVVSDMDDIFAATGFATLHPELRMCFVRMSEVRAAFPGPDPGTESLRQFLQYAYEHWSIAPQYVLLLGHHTPSHADTNPYYEWNDFGHAFANDGYFVTSSVSGQIKPTMHIGRIYNMYPEQLVTIIDKIAAYQALGSPAWTQRILMLVGDRAINEHLGGPPNATYRTLNDNLRSTELSEWPAGNLTTMYAEDFDDSGGLDRRTPATRDAWNHGYGLVNALGNTLDIHWLVFMADFNLPCYPFWTYGEPTFTENLAPTGFTPVVFANTCFTNWFELNGGCVGRSCIAGDLLLAHPAKGAVAMIGPTHQADMVETYALNRSFMHAMVTDGIRDLGRLFSRMKSEFYLEEQGHAVFADQYVLIGDPALDVKLGAVPTQSHMRNGIEIEDEPVLQDSVISGSTDIIHRNVRIVNEADGVVALVGERMLKARAHDVGGNLGHVEWKLKDCGFPITENMILSFWMNVRSTPGGNGKIVIDGNTSTGRIKDRVDVFDQFGVPLDAKVRTGVLPGWAFYYADLSPLEGASMQDLRIRYESASAADSGLVLVYFDDIRVQRHAGLGSHEIVNGSFEDDFDKNGTPDFWTDLDGVPVSGGVLASTTFVWDGTKSTVVQDIHANGGGAKQVFTTSPERGFYAVALYHYAPDPTDLRVRVRDLEENNVLLDVEVSASASWEGANWSFVNPYAGIGPARFSIEILPLDPLRPVYIDGVDVSPVIVVSAENEAEVDAGDAIAFAVSPNPALTGEDLGVKFELRTEASVEIGLFDAAGRRIGGLPAQTMGPGVHLARVSAGELQGLPPGLCFVRIRINGRWLEEARKAIVLR